ncbi:MAG: hypothetical protein H7836_14210 [Magnetococcus sp. YQC-3]
METLQTVNAKLNGDMAVLYPVYYSTNLIERTFSTIKPWDPDTFFKSPDLVMYNKKVYRCTATNYISGEAPDESKHYKLTAINDQGFKISAQKRFRNSLDNFCNMFLACYRYDKNILAYETEKNNIGFRKPTFCTLTLPVKVDPTEDKNIKRLFDDWLQAIIKSNKVKLYIWRAEAQLSGNIHFHVVFDRFLDYKQLKKKWYNLLKVNNLTHKRLSYEEHSRIVWIQELPNPELIKHELSGYFAQDEDENGNIYYKHKKTDESGAPVYVRKIEGRQWGDCDLLKYDPFTINNITGDLIELLASNYLFNKQIISNDIKVGELYIYKQIIHKKGKKPFLLKKQLHKYIEDRMLIYHLARASKIYTKKPIDPTIWGYCFDNRNIEINHAYRNAQKLPCYEIYKNAII